MQSGDEREQRTWNSTRQHFLPDTELDKRQPTEPNFIKYFYGVLHFLNGCFNSKKKKNLIHEF